MICAYRFLHLLQKRFKGGVFLSLGLAMVFGSAFMVLSRSERKEAKHIPTFPNKFIFF